MSETTVAVRAPASTTAIYAFDSAEAFETAQRMAKMLASSDLVPQQYRGNIANCVIGLEMARRIGASPLAVMQNLYIVHGKPAWSSQFLIACINASGRFSPLRYELSGKGDTRACYCWAQDASGERLEGPAVDMAMAKAEGWIGKSGSKWLTMPELMLRYRGATLFARLYAPELTMGIHTEDEVIDIAPGGVTEASPATGIKERLQRAKDVTPATDTVAAPKEAARATTPTPDASIPAALASVGVPVVVAEDYWRATGAIKGKQSYKDLPAAAVAGTIADPAALKAQIGAWIDQAAEGSI